MDKSRGQFEEWVKSIPLANLKRHLDGYENQSINSHWSTWQASRAELVVKLPAKCETTLYQGDFEDGYESGYNECLKDAKENLLKAGIKCS